MGIEYLVKELNRICDKLQNKYDINYGGCCYVAYLIKKHLERLGISSELVIVDTSGDIEEVEVKAACDNRDPCCKGTGGDTCNHYFISITGYDFVNEGGYDGGKVIIVHDLNFEDIRWIYRTGSWNDCYDTKNNAMVGRRIKQVFDRYEDLYKE